MFLVIALLVIPLFIFAYFNDTKKAKEQYILALTSEYPLFVSKLALLYSSGMTINGAMEKICMDYKLANNDIANPLYDSLAYTVNRIKQGNSAADEYKLFGRRCMAPCFLRFGNLMYRNLIKGSSDLDMVLREEVTKAYEAEKQLALKQSGEAGTKLLLPMMMIFVVIMVLIMIPALSSVSLK